MNYKDENFSWYLWAMSFLPENTKKRKNVILMIIGAMTLLSSVWVPALLFAILAGTWAEVPIILTGILIAIGGIITFVFAAADY